MRRNILFSSALLWILFFISGCSIFQSGPDADQIISDYQKAIDPDNKTLSIKSYVVTYNLHREGQATPGTLEITAEVPNKIRFEYTGKDKVGVRAWDGKTGWEYTTKSGIRVLSGRELDELRFQAGFLAPNMDEKTFFSKIILDGSAKVFDEDCWKLTMVPKPEYKSQDITAYISKKTKYLVKNTQLLDSADKTIMVQTIFKNFQNVQGIMIPYTFISELNGNITESELTDIQLNVPVDDQQFMMPQSLSN